MALGILGHTTAHAQLGGVPLWTNRYSNWTANAIAVDGNGNGNVFVTGFTTGSGGYTTIKYSGAGVPLWTNFYMGDRSAPPVLALDGSGNVFVTGGSYGSGGEYDYATINYSGMGVPLWTNRYNGPGNANDSANALAVDGSGNVFVTGSSAGTNNDIPGYATIKYSGAGVPLWTNRYENSDGAIASTLVVDDSGNVFVTGSGGGTIAYSGAGVPLWTNSSGGESVAVDSSGNVFVTGVFGTDGYPDYVMVAYSGSGVPLWTNRYYGPGDADDYASAVAVDRAGNVFVTGDSWDGSSYGYVTIKYSSAIPPTLAIARTATNTIAISWPSPSTGWNLQVNPDLTTTNRSTPGETVQDNGTLKFIIVSPPAGDRFYRLRYP